MKRTILALVCACLLIACSGQTHRTGVPETPRCAHGDALPSRQGFFHEVLFAAPSLRTPRFDDYTAGSYHIRKLDLAEGLPDQARLCGVRVKALVVVGPIGLRWSFHVAALLHEGDGYRVNALVMPHARITGKATGLIPVNEGAAMLDELTHASLVHPGLPTQKPQTDLDFSYRMLIAIYDGERPRYFHADFDELSGEELLARVDRLLGTTTKTTYPHRDSVH